MEKDFFILYSSKNHLSLSIGHNNTADWCIEVFDYKKSKLEPIFIIQCCVREEAFAKAYVKLADYFNNDYGGY